MKTCEEMMKEKEILEFSSLEFCRKNDKGIFHSDFIANSRDCREMTCNGIQF